MSACKGEGNTSPAPRTIPSATVDPVASLTPAPTSTGPMYRAKGLDLCGKTDLTPLADLKVKVDKKNPKPGGWTDADAVCFFDMHIAGGREASLLVAVTTLKSIEEAKVMCRALRKHGEMNHEGPLSGVGDEADSYSLETDKNEYQQAQSMLRARFDNRVVEVWLSAFAKPFLPKTTLSEKVRTMLQATAALASNSHSGEVPPR